jgi:hypothetical protein
MQPEGNSIQHLKFFLNKLDKKEPFSIIRPGDGEYMIIKGQPFGTQDNWKFSGGSLQNELLYSIKKAGKMPNMYVGIACHDCVGKDIINEIKTLYELNNATYANIFCNKNWQFFINYLSTNKTPLYYIGPGTCTTNKLNIIDRYHVDENLIEKWDTIKQEFMSNILSWCKDKNSIFCFSAGPISKLLIPLLTEINPTSTYLDVGSAFDIFLKETSNRGYITDNGPYSNIVCDFEKGHQNNTVDFNKFLAGWSYSPNEIRELFKHISFKDNINVLECGAGSSTVTLYNMLTNFCNTIVYDLYESDVQYIPNNDNITTYLYNANDIDNIVLPNRKYDIILIDGSTGINRFKWYSKLKNVIDKNTIILIDDFNHFYKFKYELDRQYTYSVLSYSDVPFIECGEHSWIIITNVVSKEIIEPEEQHDITCILNVYRRPHTLIEQIQALRLQSIPVSKIIIWRNHYDGCEIPQEVVNDKSITIINSSENFGVWARFAGALLANTTYVCVFDDDTIPGKRWLENCIVTMKKVNGLLGTIGVIFEPNIENNYALNTRWGWDDKIGANNTEIKQVDIVGHSWFFKREWLQHLWKTVPNYSIMQKAGEDIGFSWALQQVGIKTYVPPHPPGRLEFFGSHPELAWKYGADNVATAESFYDKFHEAFRFYRNKGFKILLD